MNSALTPEKNQKSDARALFDAASDGDATGVARLLSAGVEADARLAPGGETPLMRAAARGHEEVARVLLDAGADASAQRSDGFTPLILAVFFGHEATARLLVERGADARAHTTLGTTAARWAASRGFEEMADLLRAAEAASPRVLTEKTDTPAVVKTTTPAPAETPTRASSSPSDEVSIFSRKGEGRDSRGAVARAYALTNGASISEENAERSVSASDASRSDVFASDISRPGASASDAASPDLFAHDSATGVSVRRGAQAPGHPSASTFRLGHFLRSWQGSTGVALLLLAFGVAVFALVRGGAGGVSPRPAATPQTPAPQAAAQVPTPLAAQPTPDPLSVMPVTDPAYAVPYTPGQPIYVPQQTGAPVPVGSNIPGELTVISENGATSNANAGGSARKTEPNANTAAPARPETRGDAGAEADARPARTPEPEQQRPAPPVQSNQPPPPAPQATPGRAKVIPWPPQ
ncbi:MAG: ankyrin repeat domain-containing protein [Pyrinomonadaceae bacterium]